MKILLWNVNFFLGIDIILVWGKKLKLENRKMLRMFGQILISDTATWYFYKIILQPGMKSKVCLLCSLQFHSSVFNFSGPKQLPVEDSWKIL